MSGNDIFSDPGEVEADLSLLEQVLWCRAEVCRRLVGESATRDEQVLDVLRIDAMYEFAEYFYLLRARSLLAAEQVAALADAHNAHMVALSRDRAKMRRLGLRQERLLDAMFTADTLPRLLETWKEAPGTLDQSNLARLMVTVMSTETCRKLVVACAAAGFLDRRKSAYGTVLVRSAGIMEQVFGATIRDARRKILASNTGEQACPQD